MALASGTRLGPYEILAQCGAGGMGEVYRARDSRLDRIVAVKVLTGELATDKKFRARFEREARAAAALTHPNICALHDVGEAPIANAEPTLFLVMEYLEGETLADRLARGPLRFDKALEYAEGIGAALDKAHRHGIVHRDLKPANVMLTKEGAKLLDFGIAKRDLASGGATTGHAVTVEGAVLGTVDYMAPEQVLGRAVDKRTDIFAFGVVLVEMLVGRRPFEGRSRTETLAAIVESEASLAALDTVAPPAVARVIARCLAKDPDERWQDVRDITAALRLVADTRARVPSRENARLPWQVAAFGGAAVVLVGAWFGFGNPPATTSGTEQPFSFEINPPAGSTFARVFSYPRPSLSPDGRSLAYVAALGETDVIFVQRLGDESARPLQGTDGALYVFWSPDSRFIGFIQQRRLRRIAVAPGGAPQDVTGTPAVMGGTWAADDTILFGDGRRLYRVAAAGGEGTPVTTLDESRAEYSHRFPVLLRDGERFVYLVLSAEADREGLYLGSLRDPARKQLLVRTDVNGQVGVGADGREYLFFVRDFGLLAQPLDAARGAVIEQPTIVARPIMAAGGSRLAPFAAGGRTLAYRVNRFPGTRLLWVDRRGVPQRSLGVDGEQFRSPALSRDGARVLVRRTNLASNELWTIDLTRDNLRERLVNDPVAVLGNVWSRDGSVFYASSRGGVWSVRRRANDGRDETLLESREMSQYPTDVTTDNELVFDAERPGNKDVWALPLVGERTPRPLLNTPLDEYDGQVSPDGRWLAYTLAEDDMAQLYVTSFAAPSRGTRVSPAGGAHPRWRRDGAELYYLAPDDTVMAVQVRAGMALDLSAPEPLFRGAFDVEARNIGAPYAPAPDGQTFLVNESVEPEEAKVTVRMNWSLEPAGL